MDVDDSIRRTIEAVWRIESSKVIARLTRLVGNLGTAEELAQDTFEAALRRWPQTGIPDNPVAWLMSTAKFLSVDLIRRRDRLAAKHAEMGAPPEVVEVDFDTGLEDTVGDDLLGLIFMSCHPILPEDGRVALTLRLLGGLTTAEIARAFLVPEPTIAQRIVRAKRTLAAANVRFELPDATERRGRLHSVLEVVYLIFNEGYAASAGDDWMRAELSSEAMRLARVIVGLVPDEPEAHGLLALMEIQASRQSGPPWSRRAAGVAAGAEPRLVGPDPHPSWARRPRARPRARWRSRAICVAGRDRGMPRGGSPRRRDGLGPHRRPLRRAVASGTLASGGSQPRVALGMAFGPDVGLELADQLVDVPVLANYHLLYGVRGDLLAKLGRHREAAESSPGRGADPQRQ